jgi:hypothetical protein
MLSRLAGPYHGVGGRVKMLGGVLVLRIVAAADMAADQAHAQMHPAVPASETFLATVGITLAVCDSLKVQAVLAHGFPLAPGFDDTGRVKIAEHDSSSLPWKVDWKGAYRNYLNPHRACGQIAKNQLNLIKHTVQ